MGPTPPTNPRAFLSFAEMPASGFPLPFRSPLPTNRKKQFLRFIRSFSYMYLNSLTILFDFNYLTDLIFRNETTTFSSLRDGRAPVRLTVRIRCFQLPSTFTFLCLWPVEETVVLLCSDIRTVFQISWKNSCGNVRTKTQLTLYHIL